MSIYAVGFICFVIGFFVGFIVAAIMAAAKDESDRILLQEAVRRHTEWQESGESAVEMHWRAYEEGRWACRECKGPNPYPVGSVPFKSWNKGWLDQMEGVKPE